MAPTQAHGTTNGYTNYGCRCVACTEAHAAERRAQRRRRKQAAEDVIRADEREQWAAWLESWLGAIGPEPPTPEAILAWLRADRRPFGIAATATAPS